MNDTDSVDSRTKHHHLTDLAKDLNVPYGIDLAQVCTSGPRQGLDDETPYIEVARGHTTADVLVAIGIDSMDGGYPWYLIEVYTLTAWGDMGEPFMVFPIVPPHLVEPLVTRYVPHTPTV